MSDEMKDIVGLIKLIDMCDCIDELFQKRNNLVEELHGLGVTLGLLEAITGSSKDNLKDMLRRRRRLAEEVAAS